MDINELLENFEMLDNWEDRYSYIIELGKELPKMDNSFKTEENKVQGCSSQVWMVANNNNDKFEFIADSDSSIVKGLIAILKIIYNEKTKKEIQKINIEDLFKQMDLENHISVNRRNGFFSMVSKIKELSK